MNFFAENHIKQNYSSEQSIFHMFSTLLEGVFRYKKFSARTLLGSQYRFVLAWCWAAQLADTTSGAVCCSWDLTCAEVCHCAPRPLCHLQHLLWLLVGEASGTITVLCLSAPGVPVCFPATCHSHTLTHTHLTTYIPDTNMLLSISMYNNSVSLLCSMPIVGNNNLY